MSIKQLIVPVFIGLIIALCYLLFLHYSLRNEYRSVAKKLSVNRELLELSNKGKAKILSQHDEPYSQNLIKISSPLFEGRKVTVKELLFRGSKIKQMDLTFDYFGVNREMIKVSAFDYDSDLLYLNMVAFDEEQNMKPFLIINPKDKLSEFTSKKGYKWARACGELGYIKNISSNHILYISISGDQCLGTYYETAEDLIRESTKNAEKVADTVNF